jgi:hypothetical protein
MTELPGLIIWIVGSILILAVLSVPPSFDEKDDPWDR